MWHCVNGVLKLNTTDASIGRSTQRIQTWITRSVSPTSDWWVQTLACAPKQWHLLISALKVPSLGQFVLLSFLRSREKPACLHHFHSLPLQITLSLYPIHWRTKDILPVPFFPRATSCVSPSAVASTKVGGPRQANLLYLPYDNL